MKKTQYWDFMMPIIIRLDDSEKFSKNIKNPYTDESSYEQDIGLKIGCNTKLFIILEIMEKIKINQYEFPNKLLLKEEVEQYKEACNIIIKINAILSVYNIRKALIAYDNTLKFDILYTELIDLEYKCIHKNNKFINKDKLFRILINSSTRSKLSKICTFDLINKNNI